MQKRPSCTVLRALGRLREVLGAREDVTPKLNIALLSGLEVLGTCQAVTVGRISRRTYSCIALLLLARLLGLITAEATFLSMQQRCLYLFHSRALPLAVCGFWPRCWLLKCVSAVVLAFPLSQCRQIVSLRTDLAL